MERIMCLGKDLVVGEQVVTANGIITITSVKERRVSGRRADGTETMLLPDGQYHMHGKLLALVPRTQQGQAAHVAMPSAVSSHTDNTIWDGTRYRQLLQRFN